MNSKESYSHVLNENEPVHAHLIGTDFLSHSILVRVEGRLDRQPLTREYIESQFDKIKTNIPFEQSPEDELALDKIPIDKTQYAHSTNDLRPWKAAIGKSADNFIGVSMSEGEWGTSNFYIVGNTGAGRIGAEMKRALSSKTMSVKDLYSSPGFIIANKRAAANARRIAMQFATEMGLEVESYKDVYSHQMNDSKMPVVPLVAEPITCVPTHSIAKTGDTTYAVNRGFVNTQLAFNGVIHHINATEGDLFISQLQDRSLEKQFPVSIERNPNFNPDSIQHTREYESVRARIASPAYHWENKESGSHPVHASPSFTLPFTKNYVSSLIGNTDHERLRPVVRLMGHE